MEQTRNLNSGQIYLLCPQCGAEVFYLLESPNDYRTFLVTDDYRLVSENSSAKPNPPPSQKTRINCTSCSWTGKLSELKVSFLGLT